jgi:hypothetical protein
MNNSPRSTSKLPLLPRAPSAARAAACSLLLAALSPSAAWADPPADGGPTPAQKKAGYSLPWMMRPAVAGDLIRADAAIARQDGSTTMVPTLLAGARPFGGLPLGFYGRAAVVHDSAAGGTIVSNPIAFALYTPELAPSLKLSLFGGVTLPIGGGGGNTPAVSSRATAAQGIYARQAMDNALFATNYTTPTVGAGLAWVRDGLTAQAEATVLELVRVKGADLESDAARTNYTSGLHEGYQLVPALTASVEAHYQRWLSTPIFVEKDDSKRQQATVGVGLRANVPLSSSLLIRPGVAYFHPVDDPMAKAKYRIVQIDLPFVF